MVDTVYDAAQHGNVSGWNWDIAIDTNGHPVIVYTTLPSASHHIYHYARWSGTAWADTAMIDGGGTIGGALEPNYSPGITLDHDNPATVFLARQIGSYDEIEKWTTPDGGVTWTSRAITSGSTEQNVRPVVPRHHDATVQVLWMYGYYPFWTQFQTGIKVYPALRGASQTTGEAYVQIPDVSNTADTTVYMYYGNPNPPPPPAPSMAWGSTYRLVEHMTNVAGVDSAVADSSTAQNNGTKVGADKPLETVGLTNKAQYFDGASDLIRQNSVINMAYWPGLTVEAWIKLQSTTSRTTSTTIVTNLPQTLTATSPAGMRLGISATTNTLQAYITTSAGGGRWSAEASRI